MRRVGFPFGQRPLILSQCGASGGVGKLRPDVREGLGDKQTPMFCSGDASRPQDRGASGRVWQLGPDVREGMGD